MAWKTLERPKTVLASKSLVKEFTEMDAAPHDRPLSERRLMVYRRILKDKAFRTVTWASVLCKETNNTYRVNGKHTSTMLLGIDPLPEFHVTVERYQCDTLHDVGSLYNTFDSKLASRSAADINMAFAATIPELADVSPRLISYTVSAAAFHKWGDNELKSVPPAERAEELIDCYPFALWLKKFFGSGQPSKTGATGFACRTPVVTAMMTTYNKSRMAAEDFWSKVLEETDPDREHPTRVLARYLIRAALSGGSARGGAGNRKLVTWREMYVKSLHAWNAYRKGEKTALNYHADSDIPAVK